MAMGRKQARDSELWVTTESIAKGPGHPFYAKLNEVLENEGFDRFVEERCARFYAERTGRPSIPPGVYFRMLLVGYFEGLDSERAIAWRSADSLGLREFLGYDVTQRTPNHSTLSVIRGRLDVQTHQEVFTWVLKVLTRRGLIKGKTVGVDSTTLEANAALKSIVRCDTGQSYDEYLEDLAKSSGIETPTRQDLARMDRKRKKKGSNDDWEHPHDPDAKITKMKDGRTHLGHTAEHTVDMDTGATLAVTVQPADRGDTQTLSQTLCETMENLSEVSDACGTPLLPSELVADKGYHSNDVMVTLEELEVRSYISEPDRGRRVWKGKSAERDAVYANRRRIRGERGKRLLRKRGELLERPFAHCYETGAMRRTHLRGHDKIIKRLLVHVAGTNLSLLMRTMCGIGKPKALQGRVRAVLAALQCVVEVLIILRAISVQQRAT